jgi:hypothetical protein
MPPTSGTTGGRGPLIVRLIGPGPRLGRGYTSSSRTAVKEARHFAAGSVRWGHV